MIERIVDSVPERWRDVVGLVTAPIAWVPELQRALVAFFLESASPWAAAAKYVFLLLPALLGIVAIWCTQLSLYTLPFRAGRTRFVSLVLLAWWDAGRAVWMYWVGLARFAVVTAGWGLALGQLLARLAAALATTGGALPAAMRRSTTLPSLGVAMLGVWCVLEAAVFTHTARPTMARVLADVAGVDETSRLIGPAIFLALWVLVMGSFACLHALADAVRRRQAGLAARLVVVELFVMLFEVMFLYRHLALATLPELAPDAGVRLRLLVSVTVAAAGWVGVRGATWMLFGRYGLPPILSLMSGTPAPPALAVAPSSRPAWWRSGADGFERDVDWLHAKSEQLVEFLAVPALQLLAAALNFAMALAAGRLVFSLPLHGLREITDQRDLESTTLTPRKSVSV